MSAPSPRPSAFLVIGNDLLGELRIALRPFAVNVVKNDRFPETWRFGKPYVARNNALKDLSSKKAAQIRSHLPRQSGSLVEHGKQDTFDFKTGIQSPANAH